MAITKVTTIEELISALNTQGTTELSLASNINLNGNKIAAPFDGFTIDAGSYAIVASTGSSITGFNIISSADAAIVVAGDNVSVTNNTISTTGTAIKSDIGVADLTVTGNRITSSGTANVIDIANASGTLTVDNNTISCSSIPMGVVVTDSTAAISVSGNAISYAIAKSGEAIAITAPKAAAISTEANTVSNLAAAPTLSTTPAFSLASVGASGGGIEVTIGGVTTSDYATTQAAMAAAAASTTGEATVNFLTTEYATSTTTSNVNFGTSGKYKLTGGDGAYLNFEVQLNDDKSDSVTAEMNITNAKISAGKINLYTNSTMTIKDSTVDFNNFESGSSWFGVKKNSVLTIDKSTVGYKTPGYDASVDNFYGPTMRIYGTMTVKNNSTLYSSVGSSDMSASGEGGEGLNVCGNGTLTVTDSTVYMAYVNLGNEFASNYFYGGASEATSASITLDNGKMYNTQYAGSGKQLGSRTYGFVIGDGSTTASAHAGVLTLKNGSIVDLTGTNANQMTNVTVKSNGAINMDATSSIKLNTITNAGTITVDMTDATAAVYKLIDANADSDYGTYDFATGKANGYTLTVDNNDLVAYDESKVDKTTLVVDASWTGKKTLGDAVTVGTTTYYYGLNAFSNFSDTAAAVTADTTAINFAAGTYAAPYGAALKNSSGETLKITTDGAVVSSDPINCTGTVLKLGTASDTVAFFNEATAEKYELTAGSNLTVFQFNTEKYSNVLYTINGSMTTQGTYYTKAGTRTDIAKGASLTLDGSIRPSANGTGFYSYGTTNVYGTLTLNLNEINSDKRIKIGYSSYQNKDAQMNVDGGTVTIRGVASAAPSWESFDDSNPAVVKIFGNYSKIEGDAAASLTVTNGGLFDTAGTIENEGTITVDTKDSLIKAADITNSGTITADLTGSTVGTTYKLIDYTGSTAKTLDDYGTLTVTNGFGSFSVGTGENAGDLYVTALAPVCQIVETEVKYTSLADAIDAVADGQTIQILVDSVELPDTVTPNGREFTIQGLAPVSGVLQTQVTKTWSSYDNIAGITFKDIDFATDCNHLVIGTTVNDTVTFTNCRFSGPGSAIADARGPGKLILTDCVFEQNGTYDPSRDEYAIHFDQQAAAIIATNCKFRSKINGYVTESTFTGCTFDGGSTDGSGKYIAEIKIRGDVTFNGCTFTQKFANGILAENNRDDNGFNIALANTTYSFTNCSITGSEASVSTLVGELKTGSSAVFYTQTGSDPAVLTGVVAGSMDTLNSKLADADKITGMDGLTGRVKYTVSGDTKTLTADSWTNGSSTYVANLSGTLTVPEGVTFAVASDATVTANTVIRLATNQGSEAYNTFCNSLTDAQKANATVQGWVCSVTKDEVTKKYYTIADAKAATVVGDTITLFAGDESAASVSMEGRNLTITDGKVASVYGGLDARTAKTTDPEQSVTGDISIVINGGTVTGATDGNPGGTDQWSGQGGIYGGGIASTVNGNTSITITGGSITGNVVGGGFTARDGKNGYSMHDSIVNGNTSVTITGTSENKVTITGNVVGAGYGYNGVSGTPNVSKVTGTSTVNISNAVINGFVAGGGAGKSGTNSNETVAGDITLTISDSTINGAVYGGTNASQWNGITVMSDKIVTTLNNVVVSGKVYGGNRYVTTDGTAMNNDVYLNINGGTYNGTIYGGSEADGSQANWITVKNTHVTITDGLFDDNVYGGSANTSIAGNAELNISGGTFNYVVFGGGNGKASTAQNTSVTVSGGTFNSRLAASGKNNTVAGNATMTITGGTFKGALYGEYANGTTVASVTGTTTLNLNYEAGKTISLKSYIANFDAINVNTDVSLGGNIVNSGTLTIAGSKTLTANGNDITATDVTMGSNFTVEVTGLEENTSYWVMFYNAAGSWAGNDYVTTGAGQTTLSITKVNTSYASSRVLNAETWESAGNVTYSTSTGTLALDEESTVTFSGTLSSSGVITVDMTGATEATYKLMDYTGSKSVSYGAKGTNYKFVTGKDNGYALQTLDNDLYAYTPAAAATTVAIKSEWAGTAFGTEVTLNGATYTYGVSAFSNFTDATGAFGSATTGLVINGETFGLAGNSGIQTISNTSGGTLTISTLGTATSSSPEACSGTYLTIGTKGDQAQKYVFAEGSDLTVFQLYTEANKNIDFTIDGTLKAEGSILLKDYSNVTISSTGSLTLDGSSRPSASGTNFKNWGVLTVKGALNLNINDIGTSKRIWLGDDGYDSKGMELNVDGGTVTVRGVENTTGVEKFSKNPATTVIGGIGEEGDTAAILSVTNGGLYDTTGTIENNGTITVDTENSLVKTAEFVSGENGTITVDVGSKVSGTYKIIDYTGSTAKTLADYGTLTVTNGCGSFFVGDGTTGDLNDLYVTALPPVCKIVETGVKYTSLAGALTAVTADQTIKLLTNISDTEAITTKAIAFSIDLAGFSYDNTATLTNNGTVTITDSTATADNHFIVGSWTNATGGTLTVDSSVAFQSNDYVKGVGTVNINNDATIKKPATGGTDNGGLKADGGTLTVNVAENIDLYSNTMAVGSGNKVVMTAHNTTIHGTEYAEIFNAQNGGSIQINAEGAAQNLKIKSETNNNVGLRAYINADLKVYGLESLDVTRTVANKGVNAVYASSGSTVTINTAGDALNTTISAKGGQMDENSGSNASAMALFSSWYTGSGDNKKFATLNAYGIKSVKAEATGLYGQAFAVYETYGSTLNVNTAANTTATGEISAKSEYYANAVVAAGGSVSIYGIKDINSLATGNAERSIKGTAIGVNAYGETTYSSPNDKAHLTINSANAAYDTSISAKSTSDDDPTSSWDAYAMGVYSYKEAAVDLNGIKDITSEAKGVAYGLYSYSTTSGKVNDVDIDMAGVLSATTTNDGGESYGVYSLYYSDIDIEGNGTAEITATSSGIDSSAYGVLALLGANVTLNNLKAITATGTNAVSVYGSGSSAVINVNGQSAASKTAITGDVYAEDSAAVNLKNVAITGNVAETKDSSNTYGTVKFTGTNTVDGAVTLQGNKSVTAAADSFSLTQTGTDETDIIAINGNLSVSGTGTSVTLAGTATAKANVTGTVTVGADSTLNLSNATVTSLTNNGTATLDGVYTTNGWTLAEGSVTNVNTLINGTDVTAMAYTGTVNGDVYASSGTLDLRGVDLRLKGAPVLHGGTVENPTTLDTLKATRVFFGDIYDGGGVQTIKNIVLENCTTEYRAALGVYYDELTVDTVSVNAAEGWYWDQQYQNYNYQMYTGFGGTLNINKSLTTGEYMNAGYSIGGTGITNLATGAVINCLDFQNTGNSASGITAEQAAQNIANGVVHVNGAGATLNAAALNNHAITTFGTVNLTSHPVHTTADGGLFSVNYGTGAVLTIGQLNFLNKTGDTTKNQMRAGDNAVTTIGGLTTNPDVGTNFYVTETSDTSINKAGGNAVQFTGDIVFTTYANADSAGAKFSLNLDSSDDYFTGAIRGTVSASNRWGKWGTAVMGDETASNAYITGMALSLSNGATWNVTDDSFVNTITIGASSFVNMAVGDVITYDTTWTNNGTFTVDMTGASGSVLYKLVDYTGDGTKSLADYGTVSVGEGYFTAVIDNDLYAVAGTTNAVAKIGDKYYYSMADALSEVATGDTITLLKTITADTVSFTGKDYGYTFDLNNFFYTTTGNVTDSITFADASTTFTAADISAASITVEGNTEVAATGTYTNTLLNIDVKGLVLANTWSGSTGTINVTYTGTLTESIYKIVDVTGSTLPAIADYGTVKFNDTTTAPEGYTLGIDNGDLVLTKKTAAAAKTEGEVGGENIIISNDAKEETYVSQSVKNGDYNVTLNADDKATEMKVTGDVTATNTTINNAGETVHVTRDVTSTAATTINTSGTDTNASTVEVGGAIAGATVSITNTKTEGGAVEVSAANGIAATSGVTIVNGSTTTATDTDLTIAANVYVKGATLEIRNETKNQLNASGKLEVKDINIYNNQWTAETKTGVIELTQAVEAAGNINITNGSLDTAKSGYIHMGEDNTAQGGLTIFNDVENVINGSGSVATEDETAAEFDVKQDVTITNKGHINATVTTLGNITATNSSKNTLLGSYTGATVSINNAGGVIGSTDDSVVTKITASEYVEIYGANGQAYNMTINSNALYMGGTGVEINSGTILNTGSHIYLQYAQAADFAGTATAGAVLTLTNVGTTEQTISSTLDGATLNGSRYGTVKFGGATQKFVGVVNADVIQVVAGGNLTVDTENFTFNTLTIDGTLNIDFDKLDSYTGAGTVNTTATTASAGVLNITEVGTWIINDSVYRNFSGFAGTVTMVNGNTPAESTTIVMGIGDATGTTESKDSYIGDEATMVVNGNSKAFLAGDTVVTGLKFTGNGNLYAGLYDKTTGDLKAAGSADFTQTLKDDNSGFTGTMNVGEGAAVTLEGNFGGNVNLDYNSTIPAAAETTLKLNKDGITIGGTITGDNGSATVASADLIDVDESATLSKTGALDGFHGNVDIAAAKTLSLSAANTTDAKFTGTGVIDANAKQTLTLEGALNDYSGTIALEGNEIELDAVNVTGAKFTGTADAVINADANQTFSRTDAIKNFLGTIDLDANTLTLSGINTTSAKFTGDGQINVNVNQFFEADSAIKDFSGTIAFGTKALELSGSNITSAKFTGLFENDVDYALFNISANQTFSATGALNDFDGVISLEGANTTLTLKGVNSTGVLFEEGEGAYIIIAEADQTLTFNYDGSYDDDGYGALNYFTGTFALGTTTLTLSGANQTGATFTGGTDSNIIANAKDQTFSGDISGFSGTIDANASTVILSGTVANTLNLKGNEVDLGAITKATQENALIVNANTSLATLKANANAVTVASGSVTNVNSTTGNITLTGASVTNVTSTSGNVDLTGWTVDKSLITLTTGGTISLNSANPITVSGTLDGNLNYTVVALVSPATTYAAGLTYEGEAMSYTDAITVYAAANYFDNGYTLIQSTNALTLANDYSISLTVGSDTGTISLNNGKVIGGKLYMLTQSTDKTALTLKTVYESSNVYVNNTWDAEPYAEVDDAGTRRYIGYDAAMTIDNAISYISGEYATTVGTGLIELISTADPVTTNTNYAISSDLGTSDNAVTNMTLRGRTGHKVTVTGDINAGLATTLSLTNISATGSVYGAGTVNITGSTANRFSGSYIAAGGTLTITGGVYTTRYITGGKVYKNDATADSATIVNLIGTSDRLAIAGSVYGGNIVTGGTVSQTEAASVTVNTAGTAKVYIAGNIYAAGLNKGTGSLTVSGVRTVTFTGLGDNLSFTGRVSGGAQGTATVTGTANLVFDSFSGKFNGSISDFDKVTISGNSALELGRRQTLTGSTAMTFTVTSATTAGTAMYTVRDANAWEFGTAITVSVEGVTASSTVATYTLVDNYAAGFDGFTFKVAGQSATLGTAVVVSGISYKLNYANNKLTLDYVTAPVTLQSAAAPLSLDLDGAAVEDADLFASSDDVKLQEDINLLNTLSAADAMASSDLLDSEDSDKLVDLKAGKLA